jgi:hypothetical protein
VDVDKDHESFREKSSKREIRAPFPDYQPGHQEADCLPLIVQATENSLR